MEALESDRTFIQYRIKSPKNPTNKNHRYKP